MKVSQQRFSKILILGVLSLIAGSLTACVSGHCRDHREVAMKKANEAGGTVPGTAAPGTPVAPVPAVSVSPSAGSIGLPATNNPFDRVRVFKYDGSLQCKMGKPIEIAEMQKELGNIRVYSTDNKADGLMRIQVCGAPTGRANIYEIDRNQLEAAIKLGFKEWTF